MSLIFNRPALAALVFVALAPSIGSAGVFYSTDVLATPGLVSYWRLGESNPASTAVDQTGSNPGTYVSPATTLYNQPGAITEDPNTAVHFDGSTSYVTAGTPASLNGNWTGATLMAWINPDTNNGSTAQSEIIGSWSQSSTGDRFGVFQAAGGGLLLAVNDGSGTPGHDTAMFVSPASFQAGQYNFVVGTWDSSGLLTVYVNGAAVGSMSTPDTSLSTAATSPFNIGAENIAGALRFFAGTIDEPAVFSTALTPAQIEGLYLAGSTPEPGSMLMLGLGAAAVIGSAMRRNKRNRRVTACQRLGCLLLLVAVGSLSVSAAQANILIADWEFQGLSTSPDFLKDSSGNSHTLQVVQGNITNGSDGVHANFAHFDGSTLLDTISNLDLSGDKIVTLTWSMQLPLTSSVALGFELTPNDNIHSGGFYAAVGDVAPGSASAAINLGNGLNAVGYPTANDGNWHNYSVTYNLNATTASGVITIKVDGVAVPYSTPYGPIPTTVPNGASAFADAIAYLGARGDNAGSGTINPGLFLNGNIASFEITTVPEPSGLILVGIGSVLLVATMVRRQRGLWSELAPALAHKIETHRS